MNITILGWVLAASLWGFLPTGIFAQSTSDKLNQMGIEARFHGNYPLAMQYFKMSAEKGNAKAQSNLGYGYLSGLGIQQDPDQAFRWFQKSADQGDAEGAYGKGFCYENGLGVASDTDKARENYQRASQLGYKGAGTALKRLEDIPVAVSSPSGAPSAPSVTGDQTAPDTTPSKASKTPGKKGKKKR